MAFLQCGFHAETLGLSCEMNVVLPQAPATAKGRKKLPVLWLLHGMSDDHTTWMRRTAIERYADAARLAVIMPSAALSWYQDMASGLAYGKFFREELPAIAQSFFPISTERKDNFIAGLSMGGYGAFLFALSQPERFAAAASLSGALDVSAVVKTSDAHRRAVMKAAFGSALKVKDSPADLLALATKLKASSAPRPKLYACCGSEDFLLPGNRLFDAHAKKIGLPLAYEEHAGAGHTWDYWDRQIQQVIKWLPMR